MRWGEGVIVVASVNNHSANVEHFLPPIQAAGENVTVPDAHLLFNGQYSRVGVDLAISGESGTKLFIIDYFNQGARPDLISPDGAKLTGDVVEMLAGSQTPGQYAQTSAPSGAKPIGVVETMNGTATATRADGSVVQLQVGSHVFKGDVIQTGSDSKLSVTFADQTVFSMSASARMVLNEFVYDPEGSSNSMLINLVEGTFVFVAGKVAPGGDMKVTTPVATIGIRGTTIVTTIDGQSVQFGIAEDPGGGKGSYQLLSLTQTDASGNPLVIGTVNATTTTNGTQVLSITSGSGDISIANQSPAQILAQGDVLQQVYTAVQTMETRDPTGTNTVPGSDAPEGTQTPGPNPDDQGAIEGDIQNANNLSSGGTTTLTVADITNPEGDVVVITLDGEDAAVLVDNTTPPPDTNSTEPIVDTGEPTADPDPLPEIDPAPVILLPASPTVTEDGSIIVTGFNISDPNNPDDVLSVEIEAQSTVTLAQITGLTFTQGDGTNDVTMTFTGLAADINDALNGLTYNPTADDDDGGGITFSVSDGVTTTTKTLNVGITPVNDAPVVTAGSVGAYLENDGAQTDSSAAVTVQDADSNTTIASATVAITGNYTQIEDRLAFVNTANITAVFNIATGILMLTGLDTVANYQAALRSVSYENISETPSAAVRTVTYSVNDGTLASNNATSTINITPATDSLFTGAADIIDFSVLTDVTLPGFDGFAEDGNVNMSLDGNDMVQLADNGTINHTNIVNSGGIFFGGDGNDMIAGGTADDIIDGGNDNDMIDGGDGQDILFGRAGVDNLLGGNGNDVLVGGSGNDNLDGGNDTDTVDYNQETGGGPVTVDLSAGTATDTFGNTDALTNIENVIGTSLADTITGDDNSNLLIGLDGADIISGGDDIDVLVGGAGNDTLDGGASISQVFPTLSFMGNLGFDTVDYSQETGGGAINVNLATGVATDTFGDTDTITNISRIVGTANNDTFTGGADDFFEEFDGRGGNDTIDGGSGFDQASYQFAATAVAANFSGTTQVTGLGTVNDGQILDGDGGTDTLVNVESIEGSEFDDIFLTGDTGQGFMRARPRGGDDTIDGTAVFTEVDYLFSGATTGVIVNFDSVSHMGVASNQALDASGDTDTFINVQAARGTEFDDQFFGDTSFHRYRGGAGDDTYTGGTGTDEVSFTSGVNGSTQGAVANIDTVAHAGQAAGTATDEYGDTDTLISIERLRGGELDDTFFGNADANRLRGFDGSDTLFGMGGNDDIQGGDGLDVLVGGSGDDILDGGDDVTQVFPSLPFTGSQSFDTVDYSQETGGGAVTVNLDTSTATDTFGDTDTLINIERIIGTSGADTLTGGGGSVGGFQEFNGLGGNDIITGGASNFTQVGYRLAASGITVNMSGVTQSGLATGMALDGDGGTDTLINVDSIRGSEFADTIFTGISADDFMRVRPHGGNDTIDGTAVFTEVDYVFSGATSGVIVNFDAVAHAGVNANQALDASGDTDTFINVVAARGTEFDDQFFGGASFHRFKGLAGDDTFTGGTGPTEVFFTSGAFGSTQGAVANIDSVAHAGQAAGTATDEFGDTDTLINIDRLRGGGLDDTFFGNADANRLRGEGGDDTLEGGGGDDRIEGGDGNDTLTGDAGLDRFEFHLDEAGVDLVTDFNLTDDFLDLSDLLEANFTTGTRGDFVQAVDVGSGTLVRVDSDGTLNGINFVDIVFLQGVGVGSVIDYVHDEIDSMTDVTSSFS